MQAQTSATSLSSTEAILRNVDKLMGGQISYQSRPHRVAESTLLTDRLRLTSANHLLFHVAHHITESADNLSRLEKRFMINRLKFHDKSFHTSRSVSNENKVRFSGPTTICYGFNRQGHIESNCKNFWNCGSSQPQRRNCPKSILYYKRQLLLSR